MRADVSRTDTQWGATTVVAGSALLGFVLLAVVLPSWTDNVESAQVVAGIVRYPADNPMGIYHRSAISLLIDPAALLLRLGISPWTLCVLSSGLMGATVFAALSSATFAFSGSAAVSLLVPVLLLSLQLSLGSTHFSYPFLQSFHGHGYPILLANHPYIYGVTGLFAVLLAWGLLALRRDRTGSALLGLLPWIHPSMAVAGWIGAAAGFLAARGSLSSGEGRRMGNWFACGFAVAVAGIGFHRLFLSPGVVAPDPELAGRIASSFTANWDVHRVLPPELVLRMLEVDVWLGALLGGILLYRRRLLSPGERFLCIALLSVTAAASALLLWGVVSPGSFPDTARTLMANRWLNLNSVAFPAVVFGVLGRLAIARRNPFALGALLLHSLLFLLLVEDSFTVGSSLWMMGPSAGTAGASAARGLLFPLLGAGAVPLLLATHDRVERNGWLLAEGRGGRWGVPLVSLVTLLFLLVRVVPHFKGERVAGRDGLSPLMERIAGGEGMILMAHPTGLRVSLRTGRPLLVDPEQVDLVTYVPQAAPALERIFNRVYGVTLLRQRERGEAPTELGGHLLPLGWPALSLEEWQAIRAEYGVTTVLVPDSVPLNLPLEGIATGALGAYSIPAP